MDRRGLNLIHLARGKRRDHPTRQDRPKRHAWGCWELALVHHWRARNKAVVRRPYRLYLPRSVRGHWEAN